MIVILIFVAIPIISVILSVVIVIGTELYDATEDIREEIANKIDEKIYHIVESLKLKIEQHYHRGDNCKSMLTFPLKKVLFEQEEPRIYFEASEDTKKEIAGTLTTGFGARGFDCDAITNNQFVIESYTQGSFAQYKEGVGTLRASGGDFGGGSEAIIKDGYKLRRLTPLECERLQGFPDNYTRIEWRGKPQNECPDSHRYRAIGNSMAVPVMRWIGERIKNIEGATNANI